VKAEIKPRIELEGRTRLETVIPLSTPYLVFLDPSDICNFHCRFCPTGDWTKIRTIRKPQLMQWDLYKKIIDDLCKMPEPIKTLRLYKDGEPLLNPNFPAMVRYAKESGRFGQVDTTTNGSLLTPWLNLKLVQSGLDKIFISVNGMSSEAYYHFTGYKLKFGKFVKAIRHLYRHKGQLLIYVKIVGDNMTQAERDRFFEVFGDISDRVFIEHTAPCWPGYEVEGVDSDIGIYGNRVKEVQVCPYVFYSLSINSDGTVSLCFLDWQRKLIIGDLKKQKFKRIWEGAKLHKFRMMNLEMDRKKHRICGECGQLSHCMPDDIDCYSEELIQCLNSRTRNQKR